MKSILEHCRQSLDKDTDLSKSREVPRYGWVEKERRERGGRKVEEGKKDDHAQTGVTKEEVENILEEWTKRNGTIKVETKDENHEIMVCSSDFLTHRIMLLKTISDTICIWLFEAKIPGHRRASKRGPAKTQLRMPRAF